MKPRDKEWVCVCVGGGDYLLARQLKNDSNQKCISGFDGQSV